MHGEWPERARTPCNLAYWSFIDAWGMATKGQNPMQTRFRKHYKCMGIGSKEPEPHAIQLLEVSKMHGEWAERAGTPCNQASCSFIDAWGMATKGRKPMQ